MFVRLSTAIAVVSLLSGAAFAEGAKPTDPQIAHIAYTAGVIDVAAAKQALAKTSNKDVKEFAENMVRDHEAVNKQALDLVKKLKVTPEDNDTSKSLSKNAAAKLDELAKLKGADFDKAYVANEVAYHKAVDSALETLLIPSASNAELKSLLQTGLKIFQGHEQHAEHRSERMVPVIDSVDTGDETSAVVLDRSQPPSPRAVRFRPEQRLLDNEGSDPECGAVRRGR